MIPRDGSKDGVEGAPPEASRGTSQAASGDASLGRSNHRALERTRPIGTPPPLPAEFRRATIPAGRVSVRAAYRQTMMLGSLERSGAPVALRSEAMEQSPASVRAAASPVVLPTLAELAEQERVSFHGTAELAAPASSVSERSASDRPASSSPASESPASGSPVSESPASESPASESPASEGTRLRGSFVRVVGPPTSPPPRRSRRPGPPSQPAPVVEMDPHEAFALDRPISVAPASAVDAGLGLSAVPTADSAVVSRRGWPMANELPQSVEPPPVSRSALILPPPPGAGDFEPASSPSAAAPPPLPGSLAAAPSGAVPALSPARTRAAHAALLPARPDLPTINPFAGFEAPRDSWLRRSVIIFVVALALVGACALAAIAFGLLGKRGW